MMVRVVLVLVVFNCVAFGWFRCYGSLIVLVWLVMFMCLLCRLCCDCCLGSFACCLCWCSSVLALFAD